MVFPDEDYYRGEGFHLSTRAYEYLRRKKAYEQQRRRHALGEQQRHEHLRLRRAQEAQRAGIQWE
jgi:hypothetical protein